MISLPSSYLLKKKFYSLMPWSVFTVRLISMLALFVILQLTGYISAFHQLLDQVLIGSAFFLERITGIDPDAGLPLLSQRTAFWIREVKLAGFIYFFGMISIVLAFPGNERKKIWFVPFAFLLFYVYSVIRIFLISWQFQYSGDSSILLFIVLKLGLFSGIYFLGLWWFRSQSGRFPVRPQELTLIRIMKRLAFLFLIATAISEPLLYYQKLGFLRNGNIAFCNAVLQWSGFSTFHNKAVVGIIGTNGVHASVKCLAINLMLYFAILVLAIPGNSLHKLWYVPLGIFVINLLNILRIIGLCLSQYYIPDWFEINHKVIFAYSIYGLIFLLWIIWINKFSDIRSVRKKSA